MPTDHANASQRHCWQQVCILVQKAVCVREACLSALGVICIIYYKLTLRLPSAMSRRRLQSPQNACVMDVTKDTLPRWPRTRKFFATSPAGSCRTLSFLSLYSYENLLLQKHHAEPLGMFHTTSRCVMRLASVASGHTPVFLSLSTDIHHAQLLGTLHDLEGWTKLLNTEQDLGWCRKTLCREVCKVNASSAPAGAPGPAGSGPPGRRASPGRAPSWRRSTRCRQTACTR